jgi:type VI secretion system protein
MRSQYVLWCTILGVLLSGLISCGGTKVKASVPGSQGRAAQKFSMQVVVDESANQNSPIAMDLVTITDKKVIADIGKLTAKDWFERRTQVLRDTQGKVSVASFEWVPGQHVDKITVAIAPKTRVAYVFANYINGGSHRALIDVKQPVVINLRAEDFALQSLR